MIRRRMGRAAIVATLAGGLIATSTPAYAAVFRVSADCFRLIGTSRLEWGGTVIGGSSVRASLYDRTTLMRTITRSAASNLISVSAVNTGITGGSRYSVYAVGFRSNGAHTSDRCYVT